MCVLRPDHLARYYRQIYLFFASLSLVVLHPVVAWVSVVYH
jgi:hypothetical protein